MVERRWAMTKTVLPSISLSIPFWMSASVLVSIEEVASSNIITGGSETAARAMDKSCRCPCEREFLLPSITVSYPWGSIVIKLCALASFAAAIHCSSVASKLPKRMFSIIVPVNKFTSCNTIPSERRRASFLMRVIGMPS